MRCQHTLLIHGYPWKVAVGHLLDRLQSICWNYNVLGKEHRGFRTIMIKEYFQANIMCRSERRMQFMPFPRAKLHLSFIVVCNIGLGSAVDVVGASICLDGVRLFEFYCACTHPGKWTLFQLVLACVFLMVKGSAVSRDEVQSTRYPTSGQLLETQYLHGWVKHKVLGEFSISGRQHSFPAWSSFCRHFCSWLI